MLVARRDLWALRRQEKRPDILGKGNSVLNEHIIKVLISHMKHYHIEIQRIIKKKGFRSNKTRHCVYTQSTAWTPGLKKRHVTSEKKMRYSFNVSFVCKVEMTTLNVMLKPFLTTLNFVTHLKYVAGLDLGFNEWHDDIEVQSIS